MGEAEGGLTSEVHFTCDGKGRPLSVVVTPGQRHESTQLEAVLGAIRVPRLGAGRPHTRPEWVLADRGYSFSACRNLLRQGGIPHTISERHDQRELRSKRPGRPPGFDARQPLREAKRGEALRQPVQTVAGDRHPLRETGRELQGSGGYSCLDDLAIMNHRQTLVRRWWPCRTI